MFHCKTWDSSSVLLWPPEEESEMRASAGVFEDLEEFMGFGNTSVERSGNCGLVRFPESKRRFFWKMERKNEDRRGKRCQRNK